MTRRKTAVLSAVALGALGLFMLASVASATHPRPKGATPLRVPMVPSFNQCTAPGVEMHGPPLGFPSCGPNTPGQVGPVASSTAVTVGTPDANGAAANAEGFVRLAVFVGVPGPPDDSDVLITSNATDVRCLPATVACGAANAIDGADYIGGMQGNATIRITDHWNAVGAGGGTDAATVVDIPYPIAATCAATGSTAIGATCTATTSANAAVPGAVKDGKRATVEVGQITVTDGGPDGVVGTTPNTVFSRMGIFIP